MEDALSSDPKQIFNSIKGLLANYWVLSFLVATSFYKITTFAGEHLPDDKRAALTGWLSGKHELTWAYHFCNMFDALFGEKHTSLKCIVRSMAASITAVFLLYFLFSETFDVFGENNRTAKDMLIWQALFLGAAINIVPDYLSLWETRWVLERFRKVKNFTGQLAILAADLIFSGLIIWIGINLYLLVFEPETELETIELVALFSIYSIFFYSTFLTSVWAWLYMLSTWFMRLFYRTPLRGWLDIKNQPAKQLGLVGAAGILLAAMLASPVILAVQTKDQSGISPIDVQLCDWFPGNVCARLGHLSTDQQQELELFSRACLGGRTEHCNTSALQTYEADNFVAAIELLTAACEGGDASGCAGLGYMYKQGQGVTQNYVKAIELYDRGCEGGNVVSCANLGNMYNNGQGVTQDYAKAVELFDHGCEGGDAQGCTSLGVMYSNGRGVIQDYSKAIELYDRGCEGGNARGCNNLGIMYKNGQGVAQNYAKAAELYDRSCEGGNARGCNNLGIMYKNGQGVAQDYVKAIELYDRSCESGNAEGCTNLGHMYGQGLGVLQDQVKAVELYTRACESGNAGGCTNLGYMYALGRGVLQDQVKAVELYTRACEGDDAGACTGLGVMYDNGIGIPHDQVKAVELYTRACEGGDAGGCTNLGIMYTLGEGVLQDHTKALEYFTRACEGRHARGCEILSRLQNQL